MKIVDGKKVAETPEEEQELALELQNQTQPPSTDLNELFRNTMAETERGRRDAEQRARILEDQLNALRTQQNQPNNQPNNVIPTKDEFWENPVGIIQSLIQKQIQPLNVAAAQITRDQQYNNIKSQYNQFPPAVMNLVDQFMQGKEVSHQNVQESIQRAVGHLALTNPAALSIPNQAPATNNAPNPNPDPKVVGTIQPDSQAHLRPTNRPLAAKNDKPQRRPLTENERRIVKEAQRSNPDFNEESYWQMLEAPVQVASWVKEKKV